MHSATSDVSLGRKLLRRHVNIRVSETAPAGAQTIEVFCECGASRCEDRIRITPDAFAAAQRTGRYVVGPAHALAAGGARWARDGYVLVDGRVAR